MDQSDSFIVVSIYNINIYLLLLDMLYVGLYANNFLSVCKTMFKIHKEEHQLHMQQDNMGHIYPPPFCIW